MQTDWLGSKVRGGVNYNKEYRTAANQSRHVDKDENLFLLIQCLLLLIFGA